MEGCEILSEGLTCVVMCACSACCGLSKLESISTSLSLLVAVLGIGACTTALWPATMGSTLGERAGAMPSNDSLSPPVRCGMRDDGVRSDVGDKALAPLLLRVGGGALEGVRHRRYGCDRYERCLKAKSAAAGEDDCV